MGSRKKKRNVKKKRWLNKLKSEESGRRMNRKEYDNMSEMNSMMAKEGCEMEEHDNCQEDRGWMTDYVKESIDGRKSKEI